jgi:hypothetical protein
MEQHSKTLAYAAALGLFLASQNASGAATEIAPIDDQQARTLGMVTGLHSLRHKRSGLEVRLLEADGSASVAEDPIALFLVVTSDGTSDLQEHVWRLPRGADHVRRLSETACGVDASVEVDGPGPSPNNPSPKPIPRVFHLCFLTPEGKLLSKLQFNDGVAKRAG